MKKILTLCVIHQNSRVLLGMKKRGFGAGKWNGFGGKVNLGESIEAAAERELHEEANLKAESLAKAGVLYFTWSNNPELLEVHVFKVDKFLGEIQESEEMRPEWFGINEIPFESMWQDDRYWLPMLLRGKNFLGKFLFDERDNLIAHKLSEIQKMPTQMLRKHGFSPSSEASPQRSCLRSDDHRTPSRKHSAIVFVSIWAGFNN